MPRALLTGASGFLGSHCLKALLVHTDWEIVCPASFAHRGVPERITRVLNEVPPPYYPWARTTVVTCDLAAPIADTTETLFGSINYVINFASESHIPRSISDPIPFVQNNINLMLNLLNYAKDRTLDAFVQISTDEVYGPAAEGGHTEWSPILPSTPYSASKAAQECLAISFWRTYGLPLILVNTMNPLGPTQDPEKFAPMVINRVMRNEEVTIHASANGDIGSRVYINAQDLASVILYLLDRGNVTRYEAQDARPDRWNVVGERDVGNLELAQLIADNLGMPLRHRLLPANRPGHGLRYALDGSKLTDAGWKPAWTIESTVRDLVHWSLDNPLWTNRTSR